MAKLFSLNVDVWTNARGKDEYTESHTASDMSTAPQGINPPLMAFARMTMSGSTPKWCDARNVPVRYIPV
jgi:hypothetical protein